MVLIFVRAVSLVIAAAILNDSGRIVSGVASAMAGPGLVLLALGVILCFGFFTLEPNETRVCVLFGVYKGAAREGVETALKDLTQKGVVELDPERKAAMVSNLMVVLCGESEVHPVVNTGTLYA